MTAGREASVEQGFCSLCGEDCERGESGAWWHLYGSCYGTVPWYAAPVFMPKEAIR